MDFWAIASLGIIKVRRHYHGTHADKFSPKNQENHLQIINNIHQQRFSPVFPSEMTSAKIL